MYMRRLVFLQGHPKVDSLKYCLFLFMCILSSVNMCNAEGTTPIQIGILTPFQLAPNSWNVVGLRIGGGMWNRHVYGLDAGIVGCVADSDSGGIEVSIFANTVTKHLNITNPSDFPWSPVQELDHYFRCAEQGEKATYIGIQLAALNNYADSLIGLQLGGEVSAATRMRGVQLSGMVSGCLDGAGLIVAGISTQVETGGDFTGIQLALLWNRCAGEIRGVQIGLINYAKQLHGVQIGAVNIIKESSVPFLPLVNAHF